MKSVYLFAAGFAACLALSGAVEGHIFQAMLGVAVVGLELRFASDCEEAA